MLELLRGSVLVWHTASVWTCSKTQQGPCRSGAADGSGGVAGARGLVRVGDEVHAWVGGAHGRQVGGAAEHGRRAARKEMEEEAAWSHWRREGVSAGHGGRRRAATMIGVCVVLAWVGWGGVGEGGVCLHGGFCGALTTCGDFSRAACCKWAAWGVRHARP